MTLAQCIAAIPALAAIVDLRWPVLDAGFHMKNPAAVCAGIARLSLSTPLGLEAGQLCRLTFGRVDILVDCLIAEPVRGGRFDPEPTCNLFGRPAFLKATDHFGA